MLWILYGNQLRLTHKEAECCSFCLATSLNLLCWRFRVVVFAWQPVQLDSLEGCMLRFLHGNQFKLTHRRLHVVDFA